jgi:hypothetical protein
MTVLARKIVASEASRRIRYRWPDLIGCIREKRVPIFDECAERIVPNCSDVWSRPLSEIHGAAPRDRSVRARYRGRGAQHRKEQKKRILFHGAHPVLIWFAETGGG